MLLSSLGLGLHKPQLFRSKRPVDRALGFCQSLGFDGSSAPYGNACVERDRPFPHVPSNALNDAILNDRCSERPRFAPDTPRAEGKGEVIAIVAQIERVRHEISRQLASKKLRLVPPKTER
jgi:hypothetical protein